MARTSKQLACPRCGQVIASASWRPLKGLTVSSPDGYQIAAVSTDIMLRVAQQRLASVPAGDHAAAQRRVDFILNHSGDRFYAFACPQGHSTVTTAPQITRAIRHAAGEQVSLT